MWWWRLFRHGTMICGYLMPDGGLKQKVFFGVWRRKSENWETGKMKPCGSWVRIFEAMSVDSVSVWDEDAALQSCWMDCEAFPTSAYRLDSRKWVLFIEHWPHHNWTLSFIFNCMLMSIFLYLDNWVLNTNILNFLPKVPQQWPRLPLPLWLYRWGNTFRVVSTIHLQDHDIHLQNHHN